MDSAPFEVALAQAADTLPVGKKWAYEPKFDGDRTTIQRGQHTVTLRSRAGRVVNGAWPDLVSSAMQLPEGVLLDGEVCIWRDGRLDFGAVRSRAGSTSTRAQRLAAAMPASFAAWDVLAHPDHGPDLRGLPYLERRQILVDLLAPLGPPLQPVPMTMDIAEARVWFEVLPAQGLEGIVAKRKDGPYPRGRTGGWQKVRHAETVDCPVVGYTGHVGRPTHLAVKLPDGRVALSRRLTAVVRAPAAAALRGGGAGRAAHAEGGEAYTECEPGPVVEVLAGTTRHATVTVTRVRG
ncbi:ATP-dependent DNA ligase [Streptomyces sp. NBC_00932]|uniref:ATP-dependent DNA ligase n=1 Tax=Streptomyces sp. NBC_00932 TaxID=2903690 RepID=UPI00386D1BDF|nr:ATP-dependent DNA ligase [Streptomyces sp. NBC_00932]